MLALYSEVNTKVSRFDPDRAVCVTEVTSNDLNTPSLAIVAIESGVLEKTGALFQLIVSSFHDVSEQKCERI
jgi:hypothetical protein